MTTSPQPMRRFALIATPVFLALAAANASALDAAQLLTKLTPSIYAVRAMGANNAPLASGSAVVIGPGQLVTACHVLAGARAIAVRRDNVSYDATLDAPDVDRDLCLLRVANFSAPAVSVSAAAAPSFGQKVLAAASPEAAGVVVLDGSVSGLRAGSDGKLDRIELTLDFPPAASGGGLFDETGRLVGILSAGRAPGEKPKALPASWIAQIKERGVAAMASYRASAPAPAPAAVVDEAGAAPAGAASPRVGEVWRYELVDKLTRKRRDVVYRVDRVEGERITFNQGARVETLDGRVERISTPSGGEFDGASPPRGWVPVDVKPGARWKYSYKQAGTDLRTELTGELTGESTITVPAGSFRVLRLSYKGYVARPFYGVSFGAPSSVPYTAVAWYAPELKRVVRFDASYASKYERVDESLVLAEHRFD
ncbi:S1 family peptidase [Cupriavidus basilensis]|uniref:S1 family peptidase n=1 Tax=Cupriavidus basilensis TaxID=68895 RepID=UPI0020A6758E|nr:serine protease [Cupriavidus basilensis]MCP3021888.1 serine protease [Cupriavidus basilensis]